MKTNKLLIGLVLLAMFGADSCKFTPTSPDRRFVAEKETFLDSGYNDGTTPVTQYTVKEVQTGKVILKTWGKFRTPNDVKACLFSPDSQKFAAYFHYGETDATGYTWIGVWSLENGERLYYIEEPGWIQIPDGEFPVTAKRGVKGI